MTLALLVTAGLSGCAGLAGRGAAPTAGRAEPPAAPRSEPTRSEPSPTPAATPASPDSSRSTDSPRLAEEIARMTTEFAELQNALARLVEASQRHEDQLRALERRVGEMTVPGAAEAAVPRGFAPSQVSPAPPSLPSPTTEPAQELYDSGISRMRAGELDAALLLFQDLIANHATHPLRESAQLAAGDILYRQNDPQGALAEFETLLAAVPRGRRTAETLLKIGLCYRKLGKEERARRTWERLTREYPSTAQAREARVLLRRARAR
ncbi:MAG: tetratricopeptide repeat protein [Candidatus Rokubacteria bacterium]|nr:tetratricopeptide repeat protein [Candidatus Rokubacteria bacterium]